MPSLTLQLRRLGKKKVRTVSYDLPEWPRSLAELVSTCVRAEVEQYNRRQRGEAVLPYLLPAEIDRQLQTGGKVTFNDPAERRLVGAEESVSAALQAYRDGLFAVFVDEEEVTALDQPLQLTATSVVAFVRLTFLVGGGW